MRFFRDTDDDPLVVKMAGIKMGDRLLVLGCGDPVLIARIAVKTGLTGRAVAVDDQEGRTAHAAEVATREGALIEPFTAPWGALPFDSDSFDVVVVRDVLPGLDASRRAGCVAEARRVLRPGGRCLVIESAPRSGIAGLISRRQVDPSYASAGGAARALETQDFRAVRTLAERGGQLFVEGVKARS